MGLGRFRPITGETLLAIDEDSGGAVGCYANRHSPRLATNSAILHKHLVSGRFEVHVGGEVDFARFAAVRAVVLVIHKVSVRFGI